MKSYSTEYRVWRGMLSRCRDPKNKNYPSYGGRGIAVCLWWVANFQNFLDDVGPRPSAKHTLDRINNNGNYEPGNCRWATAVQQTRNTRRTRYATIGGETRSVPDWVEHFGLNANVVRGRIRRGCTPEDAITQPAV